MFIYCAIVYQFYWEIYFYGFDLKKLTGFSASKVIRPFRHLKSEIALFIPYLATLLYSYIDKTMLGIFDDTKAEVGYYAQAFKFIAIAVAVVSSLADVMVPRIANCYKQHKYDDISSLAYRALRVIFAMAFFIAGVLFSVSPNLNSRGFWQMDIQEVFYYCKYCLSWFW